MSGLWRDLFVLRSLLSDIYHYSMRIFMALKMGVKVLANLSAYSKLSVLFSVGCVLKSTQNTVREV